LEVCKTCYIKCKMTNNKCPGCRAIIWKIKKKIFFKLDIFIYKIY
jgi:hypothetical protein